MLMDGTTMARASARIPERDLLVNRRPDELAAERVLADVKPQERVGVRVVEDVVGVPDVVERRAGADKPAASAVRSRAAR